MSNTQNSAAHWCKAVIEEAVPSVKVATLGTPSPSFPSWYSTLNQQNKSASSASTVSTTQQISPAYLSFYQQFYGCGATAVSTQATQITAPPSVEQSSLSHVTSTSWNNGYQFAHQPTQYVYGGISGSFPLQTSSSVASSTAVAGLNVNAAQQPALRDSLEMKAKKPTPSRFSSAEVPTTTAETEASKQQQQSKSIDKQPASLKDFIRRSIAQCDNEVQRKYVADELGKLVAKVTAEGRLHIHRWDLESIPLLEEPEPVFSVKPGKSVNIMNTLQSLNPINPSINEPPVIPRPEDFSGENKKRRNRWSDAPPAPPTKPIELVNGSKSLPGETVEIAKKVRPNGMVEFENILSPLQSKFGSNKVNVKFNQNSLDFVPLGTMKESNSMKNKGNNKINSSIISTETTSSSSQPITLSDQDIQGLKIVGTCQNLEKDYLRLTSAPLPCMVRPESVLRKSIAFITEKWKKKTVDYQYMCSQLKSIRQDLTVQDIKNEFTVEVYETHARVALESNDLNEYNQCQTQLKALYTAGLKGHEMEFIAYRILYYIYLQGNKGYTGGNTDMTIILSSLSVDALQVPDVVHALEIRQAVQAENYHRFFMLLDQTPNMGRYILNNMVDEIRLKALQRMAKAYRPSVETNFVVHELGFDDMKKGLSFIKHLGCILSEGDSTTTQDGINSIWNTKDSVIDPAALFTQEKLLL